MILRCRQFEFSFPRPALIMGVVNVTPDSFSDGGRFFEPSAAVARALKLVEEGADLIDIGGESTRPGAAPVDEDEELRRILPVMERLVGETKVPISIDTMKAGVARAALKAGASLVNNVAANRCDAEMWRVIAETGAGYVVMHMKGSPATMQQKPVYGDVVAEVDDFFSEQLGQLNAFGIGLEQIILDPGIGFGKTLEHNLQLLRALDTFKKWSRPILVGVSRKSFIAQAAGRDRRLNGKVGSPPRDQEATEANARLPGSLAGACWAIEHGANLLRVHDVAATRQAVRMIESLLAARSQK